MQGILTITIINKKNYLQIRSQILANKFHHKYSKLKYEFLN